MTRHRFALTLLATMSMLFSACRSSREFAVAECARIPVEVAEPELAESSSGTVIPLSACVEGQGMNASVFVVRQAANAGTIATRMPVRVEDISEDGALLRRALPDGVRIVTTGAEFLADGSEVVVVSSRTPSGKPPCRSLISSCATAASR